MPRSLAVRKLHERQLGPGRKLQLAFKNSADCLVAQNGLVGRKQRGHDRLLCLVFRGGRHWANESSTVGGAARQERSQGGYAQCWHHLHTCSFFIRGRLAELNKSVLSY